MKETSYWQKRKLKAIAKRYSEINDYVQQLTKTQSTDNPKSRQALKDILKSNATSQNRVSACIERLNEK